MAMAPLGNLYRAISDEHAYTVLTRAWEAGVGYFDTAPLHWLDLSETRLTPLLRDNDRDSYVLSTMVWRLIKATTPDKRDGSDKWLDVLALK